MIKPPKSLAIIFAVMASIYAIIFWIMVSIDADSAEVRYHISLEQGALRRAINHGEQLLALRQLDGADPESLVDIKITLAKAHEKKGKGARAATLYKEVLNSQKARAMSQEARDKIRATRAHLLLMSGDVPAAADIFANFLDSAGDAAASTELDNVTALQTWYMERVIAAMDGFVDKVSPVATDIIQGSEKEQLKAASDMALLGGYYSGRKDGLYAAAGLLTQSYKVRLELLGAANRDTVQAALILGPIYQEMGREKDAEALYLTTLHAQERAKGSNNPELSLYMRLLAEVYKKQGRYTEAESLNGHIRELFRDAFGARRYAANKTRDRSLAINRPVSVDFPLDEKYKPEDLVQASDFKLRLSKPATVEEMSVRLATEADQANRATLPGQLKKLFAMCTEQSGEALSLRSGYRSYKTQKWLYTQTNHNGKVTHPGTSEHQLGLAVDVDVNRRLMRRTDRAYQCFEEHAWTYGFILSYPEGNTYLDGPDTYEPWHWRYVGQRTALLYREVGPLGKPQEFLAALLCYEERAQAGVWTSADERDICLENVENNKAGMQLTNSNQVTQTMSFKEGL